ncbi:MAG: AarF/ABC1/UbiB kinase family protein [Dehalococcoidia bacterium]
MPPVAARKLLRRPGGAATAGRRIFDGLGATYIKFGQFIASAPGIVGDEVAEEFRGCLDAGPAVPFRHVRALVESEMGCPLGDVFTHFEETPLAAASIAVVHRATLLDGTPVAVKVLRPGIERAVATDLAMMEAWVRFLAARGIDQAYNMVGLVVGLKAQIAEELDLGNEARTMDAFRALFAEFEMSLLVVPQVYHAHSSRRVLTMELLDGKPLDDLGHARARGVDPAPLVRELLSAWVVSSLRAGAFHADIHAGNLLLLTDGRLGMIDWGIISRLDDESLLMFRGICEAAAGREEAWDDLTVFMIRANGPSFYALGLNDEQIRRFTRANMEPVLVLPLREVSMSSLLLTGDDVVRLATGEAPTRRSIRQKLAGMRAAGRSYRSAVQSGAFETPMMRMGFLSIKQLVYLERYGRMYIPDETLLGDRDFLRRALAESKT